MEKSINALKSFYIFSVNDKNNVLLNMKKLVNIEKKNCEIITTISQSILINIAEDQFHTKKKYFDQLNSIIKTHTNTMNENRMDKFFRKNNKDQVEKFSKKSFPFYSKSKFFQ